MSRCLRLVTAQTGGAYLHHGIYVKEKMSVIEFHGENKEDARLIERDLTEFFSGHKNLYRVVYEEGDCLLVEETMQWANIALAMGNTWPLYDVVLNNCETFAFLLKTGKEVSLQVLNAWLETLELL